MCGVETKPRKLSTPRASITGVPGIFPAQQKKKRNIDEVINEEPGYFSYKFKEGHSKNFKKELKLDYFVKTC